MRAIDLASDAADIRAADGQVDHRNGTKAEAPFPRTFCSEAVADDCVFEGNTRAVCRSTTMTIDERTVPLIKLRTTIKDVTRKMPLVKNLRARMQRTTFSIPDPTLAKAPP
jgi:hypothetical protein